ncbi:MAG: membrane protein insertion efficiency factor YidD [Kiritimatiellae bacterium]|nr:membrane protein insertion efficiency factor YidD [Kiritimatiellia bacterium]
MENRKSKFGNQERALSLPSRSLIGLVRIYQLTLGRLLGGACRFYPTCSAYAIEALRTHGAWRGTWLAARRVARCHPFHPGGVDLVPRAEPHLSGASRP